jgi:muramidase (phage lysozyme)
MANWAMRDENRKLVKWSMRVFILGPARKNRVPTQPSNLFSGELIMDTNVKSFLDMLAKSEGTDRVGHTYCRGYDVIVGGSTFDSFHAHPRKLVDLPRLRIKSTAAGRYQLIWPTWKALRDRLKLPDFGPASQDAAAIELLRECGALPLIERGEFARAVQAARKIWASLPGAGYGQRENSLATLQGYYERSGGTVA